MTRLCREAGFSLIELLVVIVVIGILVSVAMQSMDVAVDDFRTLKTEREMEMLSRAIVGDPSITNGHVRTDFGYVGDMGAFPSNLQALYQNPGGYSTWDGPYLEPGYTQDATGYRFDEWGKAYEYTGGTAITSTGSGSTITKKVTDATADYLLNTFHGTIWDINDYSPSTARDDSVDIVITIPDGAGGTSSKIVHPDSTGNFTLDSLPAGQHPLRVIYTPEADTIFRYLTILPRHKSSGRYNFADDYFSADAGGGGGGGGSRLVDTLRPNGIGSLTFLIPQPFGLLANWDRVEEATSDGDASIVTTSLGSWITDAYSLEDPSAPGTAAITNVTIKCVARKTNAHGQVRPIIRTGFLDYHSSEFDLTNSYDEYSCSWTDNPSTGSTWTWQEITNLQAGVSLKAHNGNHDAYCTQVWVEVEYEP